jgi:ATP-dependent exoDNAse (exonuclease V) alpha subunit
MRAVERRANLAVVEGARSRVHHGTCPDALDQEGAPVSDWRRASVLGHTRYETIRREQALAVRHATGPGGLALVDGQAGTGKSYTIGAIRECYETAGHTVIGLAPTNAVAQDMQRDGFRRAATAHSELFALNNDRKRWDGRTVVVVDEAAMLDTKLTAMLATHAHNAGAKLILVGDDRQLSSIERGGMFGALKDRHGAAALTEVTRQYKNDDRRAASMMAEGNFHDALAMYDAKGGIRWTRTQDEARKALVEQWATDAVVAPKKSRFVFAYTNVDAAQLNADLREVRRARCELGADHQLNTVHGRLAFATGDRVQLTGAEKKSGLYNGSAGVIEAINGTRLTVKLDGKKGRTIQFDAAEFGKFQHGYAGTIYRGQGRTLDQTYLYHSEHWRSAASYVALTRHRDKAELFVARHTARDLRQLARQMARIDDRRAACQFYQIEDTEPVRPMTPRGLAASFSNPVSKARDDEDRATAREANHRPLTEHQAERLHRLADEVARESGPDPGRPANGNERDR